MIKKIGNFISGVASRLRGKALNMEVGVNLPEPRKQALVSG